MNSNLSVEIYQSWYSVQARGETPPHTIPGEGGSDYKILLLERPFSVEPEKLQGSGGSCPGLGRLEGQEAHKESSVAPWTLSPLDGWLGGCWHCLEGAAVPQYSQNKDN